ncbi:MAG: diguanylate cyclase [Thiopseudomonas sp.]|nr:diguanylate cyclase [Thiopseudomonas sp.]MCK9465794.1 diguanylate cyclase [Thiopseudomonas sp.]
MTEVQTDNAERIKQHFAVRVINEARIILEVWQKAQTQEWTKQEAETMLAAAERLQKYAERFEQQAHANIAADLLSCLGKINEQRGRLTTERIEEMTVLMQMLTQTGLRQDDQSAAGFVVPVLRRPLYIALSNLTQAQHLSTQLEFFGVQSEIFTDAQTFKQAVSERRPPVIILDVDFVGSEQGLALAQCIQNDSEAAIPVLFYSQHDADALVRLAAVRAGGEGFVVGELETSGLLELVESFSRTSHFDPYRVLVVDDSKAQSVFTERTLNGAAIITRSVNDPTLALAQIMEFAPDLIILDMYMPQCSGPELAKVIRQSERFVGMPIIYLSGEEDLGKQLKAMSQGADDFLTKPVMPHHLIATVRNRAIRARNLKARMVRDSLTGLYSHTHILQLLDDACVRALKNGQPLSFVMLDIDHFKKVNDTYGHPMGDKVIKSLALYLKQRLRKTDHIGRYGGEEFALVLPNTSAENAAKVVDEIRQRFSEISYPAQPQDLTCTFSAGVAQFVEGLDAMKLASLADEALYVAKNKGRNQVAIAEQHSVHPISP